MAWWFDIKSQSFSRKLPCVSSANSIEWPTTAHRRFNESEPFKCVWKFPKWNLFIHIGRSFVVVLIRIRFDYVPFEAWKLIKKLLLADLPWIKERSTTLPEGKILCSMWIIQFNYAPVDEIPLANAYNFNFSRFSGLMTEFTALFTAKLNLHILHER